MKNTDKERKMYNNLKKEKQRKCKWKKKDRRNGTK